MKCSAGFFGLKELPVIDIDKETLEELAGKSSSLGITVPGVQKKLSLHLSDEDSSRLTRDKYKSSYERCAGVIRSYSVLPGFDLSEFYLRLLVCFVTGNSDMHLKNFSLIERKPGCREYVLSSAYDLLPVKVIMPEDNEETALTLNSKKSNLKRKDFLTFAETIGLNSKAAIHMIDSVVKKTDVAVRMCKESYLNEDIKDKLIGLIEMRTKRLV